MSDSEGNHKMQIVSANGKVYSRYELSDDDYPVSVNQYDIEKLRLVPISGIGIVNLRSSTLRQDR